MEAIATAQRECYTFAVYAFNMRHIGRICVQRTGIVAKVQLAGLDFYSAGKARHAWLSTVKSARETLHYSSSSSADFSRHPAFIMRKTYSEIV